MALPRPFLPSRGPQNRITRYDLPAATVLELADHMNGRIYDPLLGRFLSADLVVDNPANLQSYNRYTYVRNNPLTLTDPTGFIPELEQAEAEIETVAQEWEPVRPVFISLMTVVAAVKVIDFVGDKIQEHRDAQKPQLPKPPGPPNQPNTQQPGAPQQPTPNETKLDPNTVQNSNQSQVNTNQSPSQQAKPDAPKQEPKKDDAKNSSDGKDSKETASKAASGKAEPKAGSSGGPGAGKPFCQSVRDTAAQQADNKCVFCGVETTKTPGPTQQNTDHADPKSRGGNNTLDNAQNTCRDCNQDKKTKTTQEYQDELKKRQESGQ